MPKKRRLRSGAKALLALCVISLAVFGLIQIAPYLFGTITWPSAWLTLSAIDPRVESPAEVVPNGIIPTETTGSPIEVYFCPRDDCEGRLFELLDSARVSIHCATFELNLPRVISLLENKSRAGVDVRVVVDDSYFDEVENHSWAREDGKQGLMHNKFCVVDGKRLYTGSMNPTYSCTQRNNNNLVVIESRYLSENYEAEFSELWQGVFGKGEKVRFPDLIYNNISIQNYFCPEDDCRGKVRAELAKANRSIYFMTFSFTDDFIGQDLLLKAKSGVDVGGVFEKRNINEYSEYNLLEYQGVGVRLDGNKYSMHHKVFIIDNRTVVTGSYNPTANANFDNDENMLIIEDEKIAREYLDEFDYVWSIAE